MVAALVCPPGELGDLRRDIKQLSAHTFQLLVLTRGICHVSLSVWSAQGLTWRPSMRELKSVPGLWVKGSWVLIGLELLKLTLQWRQPPGDCQLKNTH